MIFQALAVLSAASLQEPAPSDELPRVETVRSEEPQAWTPRVEAASDEGQRALAEISVPEGFLISLWAAEPLLANPVALYVSDSGAVYVAETFRHYAGVTDMRDHMDWLGEDLAARSVADRVRMFESNEGERFADYARASERVRLLRDTDGDGLADLATVFAEGFDDPAAGIGAGLLEHRGQVYFTCIPELWRLCDADGDGCAEEREVLSSGYGVHVALLGHDLHGLRIGPDGKLYFSCGDRGFRVETPSGVIDHPDCGAVLRCDLDGSNLEVFATGLRNPQELVFNDFGDLFTGDNNSDGGDKARIVHVIEGADSGWRYAYQWLVEPNLRGPWNDEKLWHPRFDGQAAYIVPPLLNLADGPSGFTRDPGTALGERWANRFFLVDFRGDPKNSGIHAFKLEPAGSSYSVVDPERFVWGVLATDADFGPDGALYLCDWVFGWQKTGKGRVFKVWDPDPSVRARADATRTLLATPLAEKNPIELFELLRHADQRVRQAAQFELVARGGAGFEALSSAAHSSSSLLARLHGVWGLCMLAERGERERAASALRALVEDREAEVRAQAARALGNLRDAEAGSALIQRLRDDSPRVVLQAALALSKLADARATSELFALARRVAETDPALRHAASLALARSAKHEELLAAVTAPSIDVRIAAVVALRYLQSPTLALFLSDSEPRVALEAARAIYDLPVEPALLALADRIGVASIESTALARRVLGANFRLGGEERARAIASAVQRGSLPAAQAVEALELLRRFGAPPDADLVTGSWRPIGERDASFLPPLVLDLAPAVGRGPEELQLAWLELAEAVEVAGAGAIAEAWALDVARPSRVRARAIPALVKLAGNDARAVLQTALFDEDGGMRAAALAGLREVAPQEALGAFERALSAHDPRELRVAFAGLGELGGARAEELLGGALTRLELGLYGDEVALDLVMAAEESQSPVLAARLAARQSATLAADPELAPYLDALHGGDAQAGKSIFRGDVKLECLRCHRHDESREGGEVGPDLAGLSARSTRLYLLESIVAPNRVVATSYETTQFLLDDEELVEGRILSEANGTVRVQKSDGTFADLPSERIVERKQGLSSMPNGLAQHLSRREMRDLIEYLARR